MVCETCNKKAVVRDSDGSWACIEHSEKDVYVTENYETFLGWFPEIHGNLLENFQVSEIIVKVKKNEGYATFMYCAPEETLPLTAEEGEKVAKGIKEYYQ
jgi:hypothetical protein